MAASISFDDHIHNCNIFQFHTELNAIAITNNICDYYENVLRVNKCHYVCEDLQLGIMISLPELEMNDL